MFGSFFDRLMGSTPENPARTDDADLALAALLVRVARADHDYAPEEQARIDDILSKRFNLPPEGAAEMRARAEALEAEAPDTVRFTRLVKDAVPYEARTQVVEALWTVVLADEARDHNEDAFLRMTAKLLGVNDRDSALARQRVEKA